MKNFYIIAISCVLTLSGCYKNPDVTEEVKNYFQNERIDFNENIESCYIIPGGGCPGCITSGIYFLLANKEYFVKEQEKNVIVFTSISSQKLLRRSLKEVDIHDLNVIIDTANIYTVNLKEKIYPLVIYLNKGNILKVEEQSPETDALHRFEEFLKKQDK